MGKQISVEALVLATYDVGEADRFCIVFTQEKGKIAARARSVRKLHSRMGGCLLPHQHLTLTLRESSAGWQVSDAQKISDWNLQDFDVFLRIQQGTELLLALLHDEEPLPELFETTKAFFDACARKSPQAVLAFTVQMLHILGLLPETRSAYFHACTDAQCTFLSEAKDGHWNNLPSLSHAEKGQFSTLLAPLIAQLAAKPLRSGGVIYGIQAAPADAA